jgi:5-methylthioadenosine/S-adenosylhomocysteine deaminase
MFQEMRTTALLAKAVAGNAEVVPAREALRLATLGGARALGLDAEIGSIVPGKWADLVAVTLGAPETRPCYDPLSHLVYACGREHVTDVWVTGETVVADRRLTRVHLGELEKRQSLWQNRLTKRSP